ncbi:MAG TPA: hypothetical protein ENK35_04030 [Candidatus Tenderia sp.]|nr:hypothetical protein [Candidatus Tenderia sp.]
MNRDQTSSAAQEGNTEKNNHCPSLEKCQIWRDFSSNTKFFWIKQYCQGSKQQSCARAKCKRETGTVPANLLPNGSLLD